VPVRILLPDPVARFVRVNAPGFSPVDVTIFGQ
jgi:hypothetical protein